MQGEMLQQMLDSVTEYAIFSLDVDGFVTTWNRGAERVFGYPAKEFIGQKGHLLFCPTDIKNGVPEQEMETAIREGSAEDVRWHARKGGEEFFGSGRMSPFIDASGALVGFVKVVRDVTRERLADIEQMRQTAELESTIDALRQFSYIASHDLREPLRMIGSYSALLRKRYAAQFDQDARDFFEFIDRGVTRMQDLLQGLRTYSLAGAKQTEAACDANDALAAALESLQLAIQENDATVEVEKLPEVACAKIELQQIFQNLLANALKFRSDAPPRITINARSDNIHEVFCVADNGIGIETRHSKRIFDIFQRLHNANEYPGTGLGLAICKKLVEAHGGKIWVDSTVSEGSKFYFSMPKIQPLHR